MLDMKAPYYNRAFEKPIVGVPNLPDDLITEFLANKHQQANPPTEADPPHRLALALAMVQNGCVLEFLGNEAELFPLERIARSRPGLFPPTVVLHGSEDTAVPVEGTRAFVDALRRVDPGIDFHVVIKPGEHGFDAAETLEAPWLAEVLEFVSRAWLGGGKE